ncbi:MAG: LamG domain-containing protein, partial [Candidatus Bathyarchaeia archaeon]
MGFRSSVDGLSWSSFTGIRACSSGLDFSIWFDGTYLHYAYAPLSKIYYRRGTPNSDGTVTWSASEQEVSTTYNSAFYPVLCTDGNRYVFIAYQDSSGSTYPFVIKSGNNDGTWGTTPSGFPYQLSTTSAGTWMLCIVPLSGTRVVVFYSYSNSVIYAKAWTGSTWLSQVATSSSAEIYGQFSATSNGDDAHLVFLKRSTYDIVYTKYSYGSNSFSSEQTVQSSTTQYSAPTISIEKTSNTLYCFWGNSTTRIYFKKCVAGTWDASPTLWIVESTPMPSANMLSCFFETYGGRLGLGYVTGSSSPYTIRFNFLASLNVSSASVNDSRVNPGGAVNVTGTIRCNGTNMVPDLRGVTVAVSLNGDVKRSINMTDLVLYLPMDDGAGSTVRDISGFNNNGSVSGATWSTGRTGGALSFDGIDDYIDMGNIPLWNLSSTSHTFTVWFKVPSLPSDTYPRLLSRYTGGTPGAGYVIYMEEATGKIVVTERADGGDHLFIKSSLSYIDEKWHFLVFTVNTDTRIGYLYVDNVLVGSDTYAGNLIDYNDALYIGGRGTSNSWYGFIDEFRIYTRALSGSEITDLYYTTGPNANGVFTAVFDTPSN